MPDNGFEDKPVGDPVQPCPLLEKHWVEIQLIDDFGTPVANEEYKVVLPDGEEVEGYLDTNGFARFSSLDQGGNCKVSFPKLDSKLWKYDHSESPEEESSSPAQ
jgi:hypothetical protein